MLIPDRRTSLACVGTFVIVGLLLWPKTWMPLKETSSSAPKHVDKVIHFAMFAAFGILWTRGRVPNARYSGMVIGAAVILAVGTELSQGLPAISRDPDVLDALADILGALMGIALVTGAGGLVDADPALDTSEVNVRQTTS